MSSYFIYVLGDPRTGAVFYVGCTKRTTARFAAHRNQCSPVSKRLSERITEIQQAGFQPVMAVVEQTEDKTREAHWIEHFKVIYALENVHYRKVKVLPLGRPTHCIHGHEFTTENTMTSKTGHRNCRECNRLKLAKYYAEHTEECKETMKEYAKKNPDKIAAIARRYQLKHAEEIREYQRKRYAESRAA